MGSTNISEIVEITNKTQDTYYMYVWDNEHEGRYTPYGRNDWHYPDDGKWLTIGPGAHLQADDCGIPDGGKSAGKNRVRVLFKANGRPAKHQGDPGRGLRINRIGLGNDFDGLQFASHATGEIRTTVRLPTGMHQSLLLVIGGPGEGLSVKQTDIAWSNEHQLKEVGEAMKKLLDLAVNISKIVAETI